MSVIVRYALQYLTSAVPVCGWTTRSGSVRVFIRFFLLFLLLLLLLPVRVALIVTLFLLLFLLLLLFRFLIGRSLFLAFLLLGFLFLLDLLALDRHVSASQLFVDLVPTARRLFVRPAILVQFAINDHLLLRLRLGPKTPPPWIRVALHDNTLDFGHHSVVAGGHHSSSHLRNAQADGLSLGSDHDNFLTNLNTVFESKEPGDH
mmetsp:Transcript_45683/g.93441  ORF Transcript_45683/g.93441 Transcript_45683/m.93441 type:complete len:204 (+) Transcript_45683:249-860(+)